MIPVLVFMAVSAYMVHKRFQEMRPAKLEAGEAARIASRADGGRGGPPTKLDPLQTDLEKARQQRTGVEKDKIGRALGTSKADYKKLGFGEGPSKMVAKADSYESNFASPKFITAVSVYPQEEPGRTN